MVADKDKPRDPKWTKKVYKVRNAKSGKFEDRHVIPNRARGGWDVVKGDGTRASEHYATEAEAVERAREIVANNGSGGGTVLIHGHDGKIRRSDSIAPTESPDGDNKH